MAKKSGNTFGSPQKIAVMISWSSKTSLFKR
jgi:hypothetical protein